MQAITSKTARNGPHYQRRSIFRRFRASGLILVALIFASAGTVLIVEAFGSSNQTSAGLHARGLSDNRDLRPVVFGLAGGVILLVGVGAMVRGVSITNR